MRIISGQLGGRRFNPPANIPARPTTDIAKEGLFNVLHSMLDFENTKSLDLFGGTGSISYELASRGVQNLTLIERDKPLVQFIKNTTLALGIHNNFHIYNMDVFKYMKQATEQFDFIFAGPPYALQNIDEIPQLVFEKKLLAPEGIFVLEHTPRNDYQQLDNFLKMKNYGTTLFSFFTV